MRNARGEKPKYPDGTESFMIRVRLPRDTFERFRSVAIQEDQTMGRIVGGYIERIAETWGLNLEKGETRATGVERGSRENPASGI